MKGSDFQKNLTITKTGDTFSFTGELNPIKWDEFSSDSKLQKGYYVFFNIDANDVAGAAAWSVRGSAGGNSPTAKEDFVFFLGDMDLTNEKIEEHTLYVLSEEETSSGTPAENKTLKTYKLDFSGVTLLDAEPFTVQAEAEANKINNIHQSLLCDMGTYSVEVNHEAKKIVIKGDLYLIDDVNTPWAYEEMKGLFPEGQRTGYFVSFQVNKPSTAGNDWAFHVGGFKDVNNGTDTTNSDGVVVRVAPIGGKDQAAGRVEFKIGEGKYETYEFDLSGVNFKLTNDRTEPTKPTSSGNQGSTTQG